MRKLLLLLVATFTIIACQKDDVTIEPLSADLEMQNEAMPKGFVGYDLSDSSTGKSTRDAWSLPVNLVEATETTIWNTPWAIQTWLGGYGLHYGDNPNHVGNLNAEGRWLRNRAWRFDGFAVIQKSQLVYVIVTTADDGNLQVLYASNDQVDDYITTALAPQVAGYETVDHATAPTGVDVRVVDFHRLQGDIFDPNSRLGYQAIVQVTVTGYPDDAYINFTSRAANTSYSISPQPGGLFIQGNGTAQIALRVDYTDGDSIIDVYDGTTKIGSVTINSTTVANPLPAIGTLTWRVPSITYGYGSATDCSEERDDYDFNFTISGNETGGRFSFEVTNNGCDYSNTIAADQVAITGNGSVSFTHQSFGSLTHPTVIVRHEGVEVDRFTLLNSHNTQGTYTVELDN